MEMQIRDLRMNFANHKVLRSSAVWREMFGFLIENNRWEGREDLWKRRLDLLRFQLVQKAFYEKIVPLHWSSIIAKSQFRFCT